MNIPVTLPGMEGQNVTLCPAGMFSGAKLTFNGKAIQKQSGVFRLPANRGTTLTVKFKARFLDPVPDLEVAGKTIVVAPPLQWYQYAWMGIPLLLIFFGGALGGFCGGLAAGISSRLFRSDLEDGMKYGVTGLVSVAAFVTYFVGVAALLTVLKK